jgi:hypothetical protein
MSNYKKPQDWSPTYLQRQSQAWCKVHKERVRGIIKQKKLKNDAKLIYMGFLTYLHDGGGILIEPKDRVAKALGFERSDLDYCVNILVKEGWLEIAESGAIFEPVVYKYITGNEHPDDANLDQIRPNSEKYGRILPNPPGETSALDKIRASSLDASNAASKERSDSDHYQKEEDRKNREGSLKVASRFSALKIEVIEEVAAANPELDWADVCAKFIEANEKTHLRMINRKWFETFVAGYIKRQGGTVASSGPSSDPEAEAIRIARLPKLESREIKCKEPRTRINPNGLSFEEVVEVYKDVWSIGERDITHKNFGIEQSDFLRLVRNMSERPKLDAHKYLCGLVGKEWNTQTALSNEDDSLIFSCGENDELWRGAAYETEEEKASRLERSRIFYENQAKAEAEKAEAKQKEEVARKEAERIRKEQEEAERQELERIEAEKRQREKDEAAKRLAEQIKESEREESELRQQFAPAFALVSDPRHQKFLSSSIHMAVAIEMSKAKFAERIGEALGEDKAKAIIAALEADNLQWWDPTEDIKKLRSKQIAALKEKTVENGCTPGEATVAAEKVEELEVKYGLSEQAAIS